MRLIDADALTDDTYILNSWDAPIVRAWLDEQPTVDAVEVVRCKDCKHALENPFITGCTKLVCSKWVNWRAVEPNHFCSYGERKDDGK